MNLDKRTLLRGGISALLTGTSFSALPQESTSMPLTLYGARKVGDFDRTNPEQAARYFQNCIRSGDVTGH